MELSTTVLEPKRNSRNVPRTRLGSGPRIPSKPLNPGQRSREITKRLYGREQSQRSCHPGPEENRNTCPQSSHLGCNVSLLQDRRPLGVGGKTQTQINLHSATMVPTWLTKGKAAGPTVQVLPGPELGPVLLCLVHVLIFPQPGCSPSTRDGLIDTPTKTGFPETKEQSP